MTYRGVIAEVKPLLLQARSSNFDPASGIQAVKYPPVLAQNGVYFTDVFVRLAVSPVVVGTAALIGTEAFVASS